MNALPSFTPANPPQWVLSFDFDGTLVDHDGDPMVKPEFFYLMEEMRKSHRSIWGLNTGRTLTHALEGILEAKFMWLPDFIIAREREIYIRNEFGRWIGVAEWNKNCEKAHKGLFRRHKRRLQKIQKWVEGNTDAQWGSQVDEPAGIVASSEEEMSLILEHIDAQLPSRRSLSYQRNSIYLRFSHKKYHKGTALAELARLYQLGAEKTFTMGDGHNDTDMLDKSIAQYIACPANAHEEVKTHVLENGGMVTTASASQGVIEALLEMLHQKEDERAYE